jgi:hypothetical protein
MTATYGTEEWSVKAGWRLAPARLPREDLATLRKLYVAAHTAYKPPDWIAAPVVTATLHADREDTRKLALALPRVRAFADRPDEALPLLGLLSWNVRQLALLCADREKGTRSAKLNPYLAEKLNRWSRAWKSAEIEALQSELCALDFGFKQTPLLPLGLWSELVMRFCH